ncbi:DUF1858 domain-containing protein [Candidatus Micrarchaeota archaeon]|nr:DUF1858 domain-containing protein [Candidatus Micrarchaeota archaeon]
MITKDLSIAEIVDKHPETVGVFLSYNLHCIGCGASGFETLEEGTLGHGWSEEELELLLKDLNEAAAKTPPAVNTT